ncbi:sulfite exporter TauE/SafE family protein [Chryseobacterium sp.]|uniref:sulfite exporter TauE/SafE family protein n=1 Tax=Chryseobacterium sp. TaxID=1871047 RepID=UPI0026157994|nr:sulfite exporter TauE/SafE family protein [Chryseobacterium sp.]
MLITLAILFIVVFSMYEMGYLDELLNILAKDNYIFYWMLLVGFLAEIVAGSMGMGYGVICTTTLLFLNIPPHIVSASIHSAESFTTAAGSISHIKLKNVSKSLVKKLAIPAVIGAIIGALCLTYVGEYYSKITKTIIAFYTLYLGFQILSNAFKPKQNKSLKKKTNLTRLGLIGGFIDSFAGGGWGPLVTGTLIKNSFTPRFAVGSSTVAKFILTITAAITFIFTLGIQHWNIILGLLIGGIVTAPFSAMLTAKLPVKKMFIVIGILVIVMSSITIYKSVF